MGWDSRTVGSKGYAALYGGPLDQREYNDPPTTLNVTAEGSKWLGTELVKRVAGAKAVVNRPPTRKQADLILVDSPNGPYFSACYLGGKGLIWRIGDTVGTEEKRNATDMLMAVISKLSAFWITSRADSTRSIPTTCRLVLISARRRSSAHSLTRLTSLAMS